MVFNRKFSPSLLATFGGYNNCGDRDGARSNIVGDGNVGELSLPRFRSDNFFGLLLFSLEVFY